MSKRKNFYYVLVITSNGPVFVTGIQPKHYAEYNKTEKPMEFGSRDYADDVSQGLTCNFILAYTVVSKYEIKYQPYRYEDGGFEWNENKKEEE